MKTSEDESLLGLTGKVALITGGGAGIGRATAELFAQAGMAVAAAEIDPARASALRNTLQASGVESLVLEVDVRKSEDVAALLSDVGARFGRLDVLVNNVGDYLGYKMAFEDSTEAEWNALYAVNLLHVFQVTKAALPLMRRSCEGGSIINLSTIEAFRGIPLTVVYAAFKAAITGFTQSLAVELGPDNIRVNAIAPETTNSAQIVATQRVPPENRSYISRWFPIGRFGEGSDSAGAALFLASDRLSGWVTGSTILVDGGALAAGAWMRLPDGKGWTHLPIIVADGYTPRSAVPPDGSPD
ncbi:SDR family NAD(P)-dependent oxidoreductase [Microvirga subterranea]|uniref:NAD(P)-dependent dehydrogenase (Short-subunit alcohol dehydrogenase family) n=1 Tax=Microvirga subterranea TaxID=186651 RepID=A0A370HF78_9HYPH|nr:SDR family NAD(P)-dependent oxidoreductase [Microvirga subterranea]RDI53834.1 NAD(P)-dependent dehydrogenase (short-subunit alcohol dehydrogenase family) [Microvirga subterranea]